MRRKLSRHSEMGEEVTESCKIEMNDGKLCKVLHVTGNVHMCEQEHRLPCDVITFVQQKDGLRQGLVPFLVLSFKTEMIYSLAENSLKHDLQENIERIWLDQAEKRTLIRTDYLSYLIFTLLFTYFPPIFSS